MTRRLLVRAAAFLSAALLLGACTGNTPAPTGPTPTSAPRPSASDDAPSFAPDRTLEARFPATIDGHPLTGLQSALFIDVLRTFQAPDDMVQQISDALQAAGLDVNTLTFASAHATVKGDDVEIVALRTPGRDANTIIQNFGPLARAFGNADPSPAALTAATYGTRTVSVSTNAQGGRTILYAGGDTAFVLTNVSDDAAATIVEALP